MAQQFVDTFGSPLRLHIPMILNAHLSQCYAWSKIYARVYKLVTLVLRISKTMYVYFAVEEEEKNICIISKRCRKCQRSHEL